MLYAWVGLFLAVTVVGLVDFYLWEYDYGHNLDEEHAIIKVPGMNYQPPLIGSKQLLNFTAHSWPAAGGWIAFASFGLGLLATYWEVRGSKRRKAAPKAASLHVLAGVLPLLVLAAGCTPGPKPIAYGHDPCAHCLMTISDERYGAELVTETGKVYPFDSVECLAAYAADHPELDVHSRWVTDFRDPTRLIPVEAAFFLHSPTLRSPMGMNLTAFGDRISEDSVLNAFSGEILDWAGVVSLVARGVPVEGAPAMTHGH
jgi:copper chaperone NosL